MTRPIDVVERVGQWKEAFDAVAAELTDDEAREMLALMMQTVKDDGPAAAGNVAMALARLIAANDRAAATVAAMLVATGIKPISVGYGDSDE